MSIPGNNAQTQESESQKNNERGQNGLIDPEDKVEGWDARKKEYPCNDTDVERPWPYSGVEMLPAPRKLVASVDLGVHADGGYADDHPQHRRAKTTPREKYGDREQEYHQAAVSVRHKMGDPDDEHYGKQGGQNAAYEEIGDE